MFKLAEDYDQLADRYHRSRLRLSEPSSQKLVETLPPRQQPGFSAGRNWQRSPDAVTSGEINAASGTETAPASPAQRPLK